MYRFKLALMVAMFPLLATIAPAQDKQSASAPAKDVDPLAMQVLKAVADPLQQATAFRFKALIGEEELANNRQIVTFFHSVDVTVQRPNKIHLVLRGHGERVDFYAADGQINMWSPDTKLYTTIPAKSTINETLASFNEKGFDMPIAPFLHSDFYQLVEKAVATAYVVGRVKIFDVDVHQIVFTAPDADYQLWVTGGDNPRFMRAEIVNKKMEGNPRTTIQFLDWDLSPALDADEFVFTKPQDAQEITLLSIPRGK